MKPRRAASGQPSAPAASRDAVLLDTGFLVSLIDDREPQHLPAADWLARQGGALWTVPAVMAETAHFIPGRLRPRLARAGASGLVRVSAPDAAGWGRIARLLEKRADSGPDWADCELIWLAESTGIHRIATLDAADFGTYRIRGRRAFDIVWPAAGAQGG